MTGLPGSRNDNVDAGRQLGRTHERHPGKAGSAARERAARRRAGAHRCAAQARQADRARARRAADGQGLVRGVRHVRRAPRDRLRHGQGAEDPGRRRGDRLGHGERPHGVRVRQGLHGVRRLALGDACAEDPEDPGHGDEGARADRRPVRCRRRAHPGGRRLARRLRRGVQAQRDRLGRDPADFRDHGAVRGRRRLLARHDRLHLHGEGHELHVRDRAGRGEDRHQRGRHRRRARRRERAHHQVRRSPTARSRTTSSACCRSAGCSISCPRTARRACPNGRASTTSSAPTNRSTR